MKKLIIELKERVKRIDEEIACLERLIKLAPKGTLHVHKRKNGNVQYYNCIEKKSFYIVKENIELINNLAQKKYNEDLIKTLGDERKEICKLIKYYENNSFSSFNKLSEERKVLIKSPYVDFEADAAIWKNGIITGECPYKKDNKYKTDNGEFVKKRIEKIDADLFHSNGVCYVYESTLRIDQNTVYFPDFRIYNPRTGKEYIFEHFGKMDDLTYVAKTIKKIDDYAKVGFVLGDNLLCDFEDNTTQTKTNILQVLIEKCFI